jgi:superfamily II DNA/RNA helicase
MDKYDRKTALDRFRVSDVRVMISSDITARGIDVQQVSIVINYDLTRNVHTYLHRIGRSGRWGRKGAAINFITRQDVMDIKKIENYYQIDICELPDNFQGV